MVRFRGSSSFKFSLRTLFILVTIAGLLAGWLVYRLTWILHRHEATLWFQSHGCGPVSFKTGPNVKAPLVIRMLGQPGFELISIGINEERDLTSADYQIEAAVKILYPEAHVEFAPRSKDGRVRPWGTLE